MRENRIFELKFFQRHTLYGFYFKDINHELKKRSVS